MLECLFGSLVRELVLLHIHENGEGYSREIARRFGVPHDSVHKQLRRLEESGVLRSREVGRTVLYCFSCDFPLLEELRNLLEGISRIGDGGRRSLAYRSSVGRSGRIIVRHS